MTQSFQPENTLQVCFHPIPMLGQLKLILHFSKTKKLRLVFPDLFTLSECSLEVIQLSHQPWRHRRSQTGCTSTAILKTSHKDSSGRLRDYRDFSRDFRKSIKAWTYFIKMYSWWMTSWHRDSSAQAASWLLTSCFFSSDSDNEISVIQRGSESLFAVQIQLCFWLKGGRCFH